MGRKKKVFSYAGKHICTVFIILLVRTAFLIYCMVVHIDLHSQMGLILVYLPQQCKDLQQLQRDIIFQNLSAPLKKQDCLLYVFLFSRVTFKSMAMDQQDIELDFE